MPSLTLFFNGLFHAYSSFFYSFHSWALYLATILLYFVLPYSRAPALVLYSSYISMHTYTVRTLYLVSHGINAGPWHLSGFPLVSHFVNRALDRHRMKSTSRGVSMHQEARFTSLVVITP